MSQHVTSDMTTPLFASLPSSYLMHHVHSKVYPAIRGVLGSQDRQLSERCRLLRGKMTPSAVGVSEDYECRYPSTLDHLRQIDALETPLEVLYTIQDAMVSNQAVPGLL